MTNNDVFAQCAAARECTVGSVTPNNNNNSRHIEAFQTLKTAISEKAKLKNDGNKYAKIQHLKYPRRSTQTQTPTHTDRHTNTHTQERRESQSPHIHIKYMYVYSKSNNIENMINKWNTVKRKTKRERYVNEKKT